MRFAVLLLLLSLPCLAHQSTLTAKGKKLKWAATTIPLTIRANTSDMSAATSTTLIQQSLNEWNNATSVKVVQSTNSNNELHFQSDFSRYGSAVIGVTEVLTNASGTITRAVIRLNDNYEFTSTPVEQGLGRIFLSDVVTHELGHFLGLSHSEVVDSTMFYANFPGQSALAYDDKSGIRTVYDSGFGRISGTVRGGSSIGVMGAHVQLISLRTGEAIGALTDENGAFEIRGLDVNDTFYLYTSPVKHLESLPDIYANSQTNFCPGAYVGSFFSTCGESGDGVAQPLTLTSSRPALDVGSVTINCDLRTRTDYSLEKLESAFSPLEIFNYGAEPRLEKTHVGYFYNPAYDTWSVPDLLTVDLRDFDGLSVTQKYLKVTLLSTALGSPLAYELKVKQNGVEIPGATRGMLEASGTGVLKPDLEVYLPLSGVASENIYELSLSARRLYGYELYKTFPSYTLFSSETSFPYFMLLSFWEDRSGQRRLLTDTPAILSDNEACLEAPFTYKVQGAEARESSSGGSAAASSGAACGTVGSSDDDDGSGPMSTLFGFSLVLLMSVLVKRTKNFLS